jgi:hypothetical protein
MLLSILKRQSPSILVYVAHSHPVIFLKRKKQKKKENARRWTLENAE